MQTAEKMTCLLVEDDAFVSDAHQIVLEEGGVRVCNVAVSEPDAIDAILRRRPKIALVDIDIEGGNSLGVATALTAKDIPVAFVSGHSSPYCHRPSQGCPTCKSQRRAQHCSRSSSIWKTPETFSRPDLPPGAVIRG